VLACIVFLSISSRVVSASFARSPRTGAQNPPQLGSHTMKSLLQAGHAKLGFSVAAAATAATAAIPFMLSWNKEGYIACKIGASKL